MATQEFLCTGTETSIWAEAANLNFFLKTPATPVTSSGRVNKTAAVKAHTRRQYPGDTSTSSVSSTMREYMFDPGRKLGRALPGKSFVCVGELGQGGAEIRRQFTYDGRWEDVVAYFGAGAKMLLHLYSPAGVRYEVAAATP